MPSDQKRLGELIEALGDRMLGRNSDTSDEATRSLGWIEDERTIPFFNKAVATDDYSLRFAALDALAKFRGSPCGGSRRAWPTQASDMRAHATTDVLAGQLADNIRHSAAVALSRSPHPEAMKLLLSLWQTLLRRPHRRAPCLGQDGFGGVLGVAAEDEHRHQRDGRNEALRYLKLRTEKPKASRRNSQAPDGLATPMSSGPFP